MNEMLQMISEGGSLSEFMEANEVLFPRVVTNLVGVAEKSAKLPKIFSILASHYEEEVENQVQLVATLLEPILMGLVAAIVGFVVIAVFLPMYGFLDKL